MSKTIMQKRTKEVPSHQEVTHKGMPRDPVGLSICILQFLDSNGPVAVRLMIAKFVSDPMTIV